MANKTINTYWFGRKKYKFIVPDEERFRSAYVAVLSLPNGDEILQFLRYFLGRQAVEDSMTVQSMLLNNRNLKVPTPALLYALRRLFGYTGLEDDLVNPGPYMSRSQAIDFIRLLNRAEDSQTAAELIKMINNDRSTMVQQIVESELSKEENVIETQLVNLRRMHNETSSQLEEQLKLADALRRANDQLRREIRECRSTAPSPPPYDRPEEEDDVPPPPLPERQEEESPGNDGSIAIPPAPPLPEALSTVAYQNDAYNEASRALENRENSLSERTEALVQGASDFAAQLQSQKGRLTTAVTKPDKEPKKLTDQGSSLMDTIEENLRKRRRAFYPEDAATDEPAVDEEEWLGKNIDSSVDFVIATIQDYAKGSAYYDHDLGMIISSTVASDTPTVDCSMCNHSVYRDESACICGKAFYCGPICQNLHWAQHSSQYEH